MREESARLLSVITVTMTLTRINEDKLPRVPIIAAITQHNNILNSYLAFITQLSG